MHEGETERADDQALGNGLLRVLVIHDPALSPSEVSSALSVSNALRVVGEAPCDPTVVELVDASAPDVVVIDASFATNPTGMRIVMSIRAALPAAGIVILVQRRDLEALAIAPKRQSPRCSFLLRESLQHSTLFAKVVEGAAFGLAVIDPLIMEALKNPQRDLLERLTTDQHIALELLASGYSDSAIADKLSLPERDAAGIVRSVYDDLHIPDNPSVHRRVKAALVFLTETSCLRN